MKLNIQYSILLLVIGIFLFLPNVSAAGLSPYHTWNPDTQTATIKDYLGIETVASIQLISNTYYCMNHCEAIIKIIPEKDISANNNEDYKILFKDLAKVKDESGKIKKYDFYKLAGTENYYVTIQDYIQQCTTFANQSQQCENIVNGSHQELRTKEIWEKTQLNPALFKKNENITIKIVAEKETSSSVDWIPKFYGVEITEMAAWQSGYNDGLVAYYKLNETSGTVASESVFGKLNGTITGATPIAGKIAGAYNFTGTGQYIRISNDSKLDGINGKNITITAWVYPRACSSYPTIFGQRSGANGLLYALNSNTCKPAICADTGCWVAANTALPLNTWSFISISILNGAGTFYINGTADGTGTLAWTTTAVNKSISYYGDNAGFEGIIDELGIWNRSLSGTELLDMYNSGDGMTYTNQFFGTISTTLTNPSDSYNTTASTLQFNATITPVSTNISNATLFIWNITGALKFNVTNIYPADLNNTYLANFSNIDITPDGNYSWNVKACGRESLSNTYICSIAATNRSFVRDSTPPSVAITFPVQSATYTMPPQQINLNFTAMDINRQACWYSNNGAANVTITNCVNTTFNISRQGQNNLTLYANDTFGNVNFATVTFYATPTFSICNSTIGTIALNITFIDESTSSRINATVDSSSWNYYSGINYIFSNLTHNMEYDFCIYPNYSFFNTSVTFQYSHSEVTLYPQRTYSNENLSLSNSTQNITLYLLPSTQGQYVSFQVLTGGLTPVSGADVLVERLFGASYSALTSGTTDAAGIATFWLNPNYQHRFTFTKTGYTTIQEVITPTQTQYTIIMNQLTGTSNITDTANGIILNIYPSNYNLLNGTNYNFNITLSSSISTISSFGFNITNASGTLLKSNSSNANGGTLTSVMNTGENKTLILTAFYVINGSMAQIKKTYYISSNQYNVGINAFFTDAKAYLDTGIFGLRTGSFGVQLIIYLIIFITLGTLCYNFQLYSPLAISGVFLGLVFIFDVGFNMIVSPIGAISNFPTIFAGIIFITFVIKEAVSY